MGLAIITGPLVAQLWLWYHETVVSLASVAAAKEEEGRMEHGIEAGAAQAISLGTELPAAGKGLSR